MSLFLMVSGPVAEASNLKLFLVRPGEVVTLKVEELDEKADWFGDMRVRLPRSLTIGDWRMLVSSETDGTSDELPLVIKVRNK